MRLTLYLALSALLLLTGCSKPPAPAEPDPKIAHLESRIKELEQQLAQAGEPINLINPSYPPAVAGDEGWVYHKSLTGDLDGDGRPEKISMTTNAEWLPDQQEFAWDDGHPWHVYVEEENGSRTHLFSNWVQLGKLDLVLDEASRDLFIIYSRPDSLAIYRVRYETTGRTEARVAFAMPMGVTATWDQFTH